VNEKRIKEISERLQATTPGAWKVWEPDEDYFGSDDPCIVSESGQYVAQTSYDGLNDRETMIADAEFIAHAKDDIRFLLEQLGARKHNRGGYVE